MELELTNLKLERDKYHRQDEDLQNSKDNLNAELEALQISKNDMKQSLDHFERGQQKHQRTSEMLR